MGWCGLDLSGSGKGQEESSGEFGDEPSGFNKMLGNYRVASQLVASRVVLSSIELVSHRVT
jgi:hypothetical protein